MFDLLWLLSIAVVAGCGDSTEDTSVRAHHYAGFHAQKPAPTQLAISDATLTLADIIADVKSAVVRIEATRGLTVLLNPPEWFHVEGIGPSLSSQHLSDNFSKTQRDEGWGLEKEFNCG